MKKVMGYEGLYWITKDGKVINRHGRELKQFKNTDGYLRAKLSKNRIAKNKKIHKLILEAFVPNPENKPCCNHKNGIKHDNRISNLEWVTHSENVNHAFKIGLRRAKRGESHNLAKLTEEQVREIKSLLKDGEFNQTEIAKRFNVSQSEISRIKCGQNWNWVR